MSFTPVVINQLHRGDRVVLRKIKGPSDFKVQKLMNHRRLTVRCLMNLTTWRNPINLHGNYVPFRHRLHDTFNLTFMVVDNRKLAWGTECEYIIDKVLPQPSERMI